MSHPNTKPFLATVTSKENKSKKLTTVSNPQSLAGGGSKKAVSNSMANKKC